MEEPLNQEESTQGPQRFHISPPVRRWLIWIGVVLISLILLRVLLNGINHFSKTKRPTTIPVVVAPVENKDVPVLLPALGSVLPTDTVTVKTQINGQLMHVFFTEGQIVKSGDLLALIDPRPYEAQLAQFEGQLARDQAILENAKIDLDRYTTLYKQDSVSQQTLETQKALVKQYEGIVKLDQGQIDVVKVNLIYTRIISPINGRVGLRLVDPGNFVQTTDPGIVVINNHQPITVVFTIPEDNLPQVMSQINQGKTLVAEAYDRALNHKLATGALYTVDNQIDLTTGTVKIKALYQNEDNILFPNQFVNVKLLVDTLQSATVLPMAAIQQGSKGPFVYVVNKEEDAVNGSSNTLTNDSNNVSRSNNNNNNNKSNNITHSANHSEQKIVSVKPVSIRTITGDMAAVTGEILPGDRVVVEGADKLTEGSAIVITKRNGTKGDEKNKEVKQPVEEKKLKDEKQQETAMAIKNIVRKFNTPKERLKRLLGRIP
jgi:multidrug efflux system membrane fusion protein